MKRLNTEVMRALLRAGEALAKGKDGTSEGTLNCLMDHRDGDWWYQVQEVHDARMNPSYCITVYAWGGVPRGSSSAEFYLSSRDGHADTGASRKTTTEGWSTTARNRAYDVIEFYRKHRGQGLLDFVTGQIDAAERAVREESE